MDKKERSKLGAFYTPDSLADVVACKALELYHKTSCCTAFVDPACGDGSMLLAIKRGLKAKHPDANDRSIEQNLFGFDVNPSAIESARKLLPYAHFTCMDSLFDLRPWHFDVGQNFTCFVGNPPFLGGNKISGALGVDYLKRLKKEYPHHNGTSDLCADFFWLAQKLCKRSCASLVYIATKTIAQGDTRSAALYPMRMSKWSIFNSVPSMPWPGDAKVNIAIVCMSNAKQQKFWHEYDVLAPRCKFELQDSRLNK
jgi:hypothetical protein